MSFVPAPPRKRPISSCLPCYNRKQKCNREIPCNHCSRRRCIESCVYYANPNSSSATSPGASSASSTSTRGPSVTVGIPKEPPRRFERYSGRFALKNGECRYTNSQRRRSGSWGGRDLLRNEWSRWDGAAGAGAGAGAGTSAYPACSSGSARPRSWTSTTEAWPGRALAESFGYFEGSKSNTLALIQKMGLGQDNLDSESSPVLVPEAAEDVHRIMRDIPDRQIIDFLVQFFVREISWMDQVVHVPWLMGKYQDWCNTRSAEECRAADANDALTSRQLRVMDVDFVVLLLRIVSYALQFLPSPIYPLDRIRGVLLADVRTECDDIANTLEAMSWALDGRGSLIRVHQLAFAALKFQTDGNIKACWETVSHAIHIAQSIGIHSDSVTAIGANDIEKEMARRIFCNLYAWDSLLSRHLDLMHALPGRLHPKNWPQLHTLSEYRDRGEQIPPPPSTPRNRCLEAPDPFTERLLQARLADFWRSVNPLQGNEDDIMAAEERYDRFSREFLSQLPPAFALADADESWDRLFPKLPLQRQMLRIAIYDSLCWNFRPLLFRHPSSSLSLPPYKVLLLRSQKRGVAGAALRSLEAVTHLHALLGGCHTRLPGIVISTFEAAVLLLQLWADPSFPEDVDSCLNMHQQQQQQQQQHITPRLDPMRANAHMVNRSACMEAVEGAVKRLKMLAEVSNLADIGASTLVELLRRTTTSMEEGSRVEAVENNQLPLKTDHDASTSKTRLDMAMNDTIHVVIQDHAGGQVPQGQGQEVESVESLHNTPRTTTSSLAGETVVDEAAMVASWNTASSAESIDVNLSMEMPSALQDFMSTMTVGDMATWSAFDESSIFPQDPEYMGDVPATETFKG